MPTYPRIRGHVANSVSVSTRSKVHVAVIPAAAGSMTDTGYLMSSAQPNFDWTMAVVVGPAFWGWSTGSRSDTVMAAWGESFLLLVVGTAATAAVIDNRSGTGPAVMVSVGMWLALGTLVGVAYAPVRPLKALRRSLVLTSATRLFALILIVGLWGAAHGGDLRLLELWPLGAALGLDAFVTGRVLGDPVPGLPAWFATMGSPTHLGVVVALLLLALLEIKGFTAAIGVELYFGWQVNLVVLLGSVSLCDKLSTSVDRDLRAVVREEYRRRANWIHDDMCGQLIPVRRDLRAGRLTEPTDVLLRLDLIDHELRELQLRELAFHGPVTIGEIVQIWSRRASNAGASISVPRWPAGSELLDETNQLKARRMLGVAVPNALAAGSQTVAFSFHRCASVLELAVVDDAGGFEPSTIPRDRGLARLLNDYPDIKISRTGDGMRVSVVLALTEADIP